MLIGRFRWHLPSGGSISPRGRDGCHYTHRCLCRIRPGPPLKQTGCQTLRVVPRIFFLSTFFLYLHDLSFLFVRSFCERRDYDPTKPRCISDLVGNRATSRGVVGLAVYFIFVASTKKWRYTYDHEWSFRVGQLAIPRANFHIGSWSPSEACVAAGHAREINFVIIVEKKSSCPKIFSYFLRNEMQLGAVNRFDPWTPTLLSKTTNIHKCLNWLFFNTRNLLNEKIYDAPNFVSFPNFPIFLLSLCLSLSPSQCVKNFSLAIPLWKKKKENLIFLVWPRRGPSLLAYQAPWLLDQWPIHSVHLVVEAAGIAQVMSSSVPSPQRSRYRSAINALTALRKVLGLDVVVHCVFRTTLVLVSLFFLF